MNIIKKGDPETFLDTAGPKRVPETENRRKNHAVGLDLEIHLGARVDHSRSTIHSKFIRFFEQALDHRCHVF